MAGAPDPDLPLTLDEIDKLLAIASKHNVVELSFRGLSARRLPDQKVERFEAAETELDRLKRMGPEAVDAALMLKRMKGGQ